MHATLPGPAAPFAVAAVLALAPIAAGARDLPIDGPLGAVTESPLRQLFLEMSGADARPPAGPRVAARWVMSNNWTAPTTLVRGADAAFLQFDGQADAFVVSASAPWTSLWRGGADARVVGPLLRRLTTSIEARATVWWGGWSDAPVEAWHNFARFTNFERDKHPSARVGLLLSDGSTTAFDAESARTSAGGLVLRNQLLLAQGGSSLRARSSEDPRSRWAVALRLDVKLPVGSRLGSSGSTDAGAGLLASAELARWCIVHANVFTSAWGDLPNGIALQPRTLHHGGEISVVLAGERWALFLEDRLLSPVFPGDWKRFGEVQYSRLAASATFAATRWHNQISGGIRRGPISVWFSEDFTPGRTRGSDYWFFNSNVPDISFGIEFAHAL